jgi:hypothetical protein
LKETNMVNVNKLELSDNKRHLPYGNNLEEFLNLVALAKPLCTFAVDNECVRSEWVRNTDNGSEYMEVLNTIKVYEDGEAIGSISVARRYRAGGKEDVYGVESFRIHKERGNRNTTYVKDIKVAMRNVKKFFTGRQDNEVKELITHNVKRGMEAVMHSAIQSINWSVDAREIAFDYIMRAYHERKQGNTTVAMPVKIPTVKDQETLFSKCDDVIQAKTLDDHYKGNNGYGVQMRIDNSIVTYSYASDKITKYRSFDDVPPNIQEKLAMFKVLEKDEPYADFGVKFADGFFYIP